MKPLISIIIPIYNVEKYIEESLSSVLNQTFVDTEIICIDDGSTDRSKDIIDLIKDTDPRVIVVHNDNHGYGFSVNYGFSLASGDYIMVFEPDDVLPTEALDILYKQAVTNDLDIVKGDYYEMHGSKPYYNFVTARLHQDEEIYNKIISIEEEPKLLYSQIINCSGIYKRSLIEKNNITLSETPGASYQDVGLFYQLMYYAKRIKFIHDITYQYRIDNPNASTKNKAKLYMAENEYIKSFELISKTNNKNALSAFWCARWRGMLGTFSRIDSSLHDEFYDYICKVVNKAKINGFINKEYMNAFQYEMLKNINNKDKFINMLKKSNGKYKKIVRIIWRFKNDGFSKTIKFLKNKLTN